MLKIDQDVLDGLSLEGVITGRALAGRPAEKRENPFTQAHRWRRNNPQFMFTYTLSYVAVAGCFLWQFVRYAHNCKDVNLE